MSTKKALEIALYVMECLKNPSKSIKFKPDLINPLLSAKSI